MQVEPRSPDRGLTVIVCDWLPPEFGAVGQYMMQRAHAAAADGSEVVLVGLGRQAASAGPANPRVVTLPAKRPDRRAFVRRGLWALSTNLRLALAVGREIRGRSDTTIVVTGSPPFLSHLLILANLVWRRRLVYRITDFYPETAIASGHGRFLRVLGPLFRWLRRRADAIEILGEDQRRRLIASGVEPGRLELLRDGSPVAIDAQTQAAPRPFEPGDVVLLYSGNLGVAHDTVAFRDAYRRHVQQGANRVRLWVNGAGVGVEALQTYCRAHGLPLHVTPPVPLERLAGVLTAADAHLVLLGEAFWGYVLPSKIYGCLQTGAPIVYVGPSESDIALLIRQRGSSADVIVQSGQVQACVEGLESLSASAAKRTTSAS